MKKLIILFTLLFLSNCSSIKNIENLVGKYSWKGIYGIGEILILNNDNTFEFKWQQGLMNGTSKGKYTLNKSILTLNSFKQPENTDNFKIHYLKSSEKNNSYFIKILDSNKIPLGFASCTYIKNGKIIEGKSADENGTLHITKKPIAEKLQIHFVGYKPAEIKLKDLKTDSFEITLIQEPNYYEYFTNRKFKIINNQILSIKSKKGQNKIYRQK